MSGKKKRLEWDDSEVFAINTKPTRNTSVPYESVEKALRCKLPESKFFKLLDGGLGNLVGEKSRLFGRLISTSQNLMFLRGKQLKCASNWEFQGYIGLY